MALKPRKHCGVVGPNCVNPPDTTDGATTPRPNGPRVTVACSCGYTVCTACRPGKSRHWVCPNCIERAHFDDLSDNDDDAAAIGLKALHLARDAFDDAGHTVSAPGEAEPGEFYVQFNGVNIAVTITLI